MNVEIISTGNEIMSGLTLDTNFNWAAAVLLENGISVDYHTTLKDDLNDLIGSFETAAKRARFVLVIGGLGPTEDDLSALAASKFKSVDMYFDCSVYQSIVEKLKKRNRVPNKNHKKQSMFPLNCEIFENSVGTAAGFKIEKNGSTFFFLPGVPREFKSMFNDYILPEISSNIESGEKLFISNLKVIGLGESEVASKISALSDEYINIGYRIKFPEVHIRMYAISDNEKLIKSKIAKKIQEIKEQLGDNLFTERDENLEQVTAKLLQEKKITIATAESCTGGLVANRFTDIPGSSEYFLSGLVVYSNESKTEMLGIPASYIEKYGAVSSEVVLKMASSVRDISGSDIGVGISGIAGPGGGSEDKPVGTVYIGFSYKDGTVFSNRYNFQGNRTEIKFITSSIAIDIIRKFCLHNI